MVRRSDGRFDVVRAHDRAVLRAAMHEFNARQWIREWGHQLLCVVSLGYVAGHVLAAL